MKKHKTFPGIFNAIIILALLLGIEGSASVLKATGNEVNAAAQPPTINAGWTTHVLVIPAASFRADGLTPDGGDFYFNGGYWAGDSVVPCFMAPVYLPRVGTIFQVWATVSDNDANKDFWIKLYRVDNYTGYATVMASLQSSGASGELYSLYDTTIQSGLIEYPTYSYYLGTCLRASAHHLYNVRVWYETYEVYLPTITR